MLAQLEGLRGPRCHRMSPPGKRGHCLQGVTGAVGTSSGFAGSRAGRCVLSLERRLKHPFGGTLDGSGEGLELNLEPGSTRPGSGRLSTPGLEAPKGTEGVVEPKPSLTNITAALELP